MEKILVKINGKEIDADGKSVSELLDFLHYDKTKVAVEINMQIVPKAAYPQTMVKDGDAVEVVSFVGGG